MMPYLSTASKRETYMNKEQVTNMQSYQTAGEYLLHLMACALNNKIPESKPDTCTWEQIWRLSTYSNVETIVWPAVKTLQASLYPDIYKKWEHAGNAVLFRQLQFDVEREQILAKLSEHQISWLPLKGILLKDYYPVPGMRYMCDNDILYGITDADPDGGYRIQGQSESEREQSIDHAKQTLRQIMKDFGYKEASLNGNHDAFTKEPIFNFEMHRDLVSTTSSMYTYYRNPWKHAIQDENNRYGYHFSHEDEYIFILVHAYKHYTGGGCGIRTLADEYVFLKKKQHELDWNYLHAELEKLNLTEFEEGIRHAAFHAFTPGEKMTEEDRKIAGYMLESGTYGNLGNRVKNELDRQKEEAGGDVSTAKKRYLKDRIWLDEETIKNAFPLFYRHKGLRPFLPIYRLVKGMIIHPKTLLNEAKLIKRSR